MKLVGDGLLISENWVNSEEWKKECLKYYRRITRLVNSNKNITNTCCVCGSDKGEALYNRENPYNVIILCNNCRQDPESIKKTTSKKIDARKVHKKKKSSGIHTFNDDKVMEIVEGYIKKNVTIKKYCEQKNICRNTFKICIKRYAVMFPDSNIEEKIEQKANEVRIKQGGNVKKNDLDSCKARINEWLLNEYPNSNSEIKQQILKDLKRIQPQYLMQQEELEVYSKLNDVVTIYRGVMEKNKIKTKALSWTLDSIQARWFADRSGKKGYVYQAKIDKENIFAYCNNRNKQEVIVNYQKLREVELYEVEL